jgi:RNA polymerase primary sigma factor
MQTIKEVRIPKLKPANDASPEMAPKRPLSAIPDSGDSLERYLRDIRKEATLSLAEEEALSVRIKQGDMRAVNILVQANLKFVVAVCRNYRNQGLPLGDLINEGNLGMLKAAKRFDGGMKFKFISYAVWWVRQAILTALAEQARVLRLSTGKVNMISSVGKAGHRLEQKLGRAPSMLEIGEELGMTELGVCECLQLSAAPVSLTKPIFQDGDAAMEDLLEDRDGERPDAEIRRNLSGKNIAAVLNELEGREKEIIELYYGIGRECSDSLVDIGNRFGITRERVRQIKSQALKRLRLPARLERLSRFRD